VPRARRIILHPGFHRTGCRSIQEFLRANEAVLSPIVRRMLIDDLRPIVRVGRVDVAAGRAALARAVGLVFPPEADSDARDIVVSAEALCGPPVGRPETIDYNASPIAIADLVAALSDRFPTAEITVALTAREAEDWLFSAYQAQLRHARLRIGRAAFAASHRRATEFGRLAREAETLIAVRECRASVRLLWLEQTAAHPLGPGGAVADLLDLPRETVVRLAPVPYRDATLPTPFWHAFLAINRSRNPDKAVRAAKDELIAAHRDALSKSGASG